MKPMNAQRRQQWKKSAWIWLATAILWLASCEFGPDINILEVDASSEPATMIVSASSEVGKDELYAWASKKCRDIMVLPPISPVPVQVLQRGERQTGRKGRIEYRFRCTRP